ncbi:hypothetical protein CAAN3_25S00760 [[Candida] anglica]
MSNGTGNITGGTRNNPSDSVRSNALNVIAREFRTLEQDANVGKMSLFDLIEYCESLYEASAHAADSAGMVQSYIRGYLVFCYFINNYVMVNYGGFEQFVAKKEYDFLIYINLYHFFRQEDDKEDELKPLRGYVEDYLGGMRLLSFEIGVLTDWLDDYLEYLKQKDAIGDGTDVSINEAPEPTLLLEEEEEDDRSFESRFPSVSIRKVPSVTGTYLDHKTPANEATPVKSVTMSSLAMKHPFDHGDVSSKPTVSSTTFSSPLSSSTVTSRPPIPQQLPEQLLRARTFSSIPTAPLPVPNSHPGTNIVHGMIETNGYSAPYPSSDDSTPSYTQSSSHQIPLNQSRKRSNLPFSRAPMPLSTTDNTQNYSNGSKNGYPRGSEMPQFSGRQPISNQSTSVPAYNTSSNNINPAANPGYSQNYGSGHGSGPAYPTPSHQTVSGPNPGSHLATTPSSYMKNNAICGLRNFGSSCYINSTLQLLFGLVQFKSIFSNSRYHRYIREPKFVKQFSSPEPHLLSVAVSGLLKSFVNHGSCGIAPSKFLRISSNLKPDFNIPNEQQDAQEFLLFLLERLHDELAVKSSVQIDHLPSDANVSAKDYDQYLKWYQSVISLEGTSPVNDLFQGHLQNKLICNNCGYESVSYSQFTSLSLPIPSHSATRSVNLGDCLRYYIKDEILTGDNAWNCPKCSTVKNITTTTTLDASNTKRSGLFKLGRRSKSPTPASNPNTTTSSTISTNGSAQSSIKRLSFVKLPQILFIHLSRFSMFSLTDKLNTTIKYPLELRFNASAEKTILYKLTGLINHFGNLKSGHYTSLVNKSTFHQHMSSSERIEPNNIDNLKRPYWCYFDDDAVQPGVTHGNINMESGPIISELNSKEVYVLCYEKVEE